MSWLTCVVLILGGYVVGRMVGRRRTRADLVRLTHLIVGGMSPAEERALRAEQETAP